MATYTGAYLARVERPSRDELVQVVQADILLQGAPCIAGLNPERHMPIMPTDYSGARRITKRH